MKREIKFRAWNNVDYMSSHFTIDDVQNKKIQFTGDCPIMQYTGLKDKNGKEIYEGDIMQSKELGHAGEVVWNPITASFKLKFGVAFSHIADRSDYMEVVGNIYEHPHLLAGSNAV